MQRLQMTLFLLVCCVFTIAINAKSEDRVALTQAKGTETFIQIFKSERILEVWQKAPDADAYSLRASFPICSYSGSLGPKLKEGDRQAPEGFYKVKRSSLNPNSSYHLSFNLGFPNAYDRAHGRTGSYLMVHGSCVSIGCYAMTDAGIEQIYGAVETSLKDGQEFVPVHIYPFRMSNEALAETAPDKWHDFWTNLKEGYDYFEANRRPAEISVEGKRYVVL